MQDQGAPVATARVARRLPIDRWFYIGMAICAIIVSVLGFAPSFVNTAARHVPHWEAHTNLARRISNETQRYVNHRVSALDPLHDVSPDGRHHPRDGLGTGLEPLWGANPGRLAVRNAGARRTAIGVRHHPPRVAPWVGHPRPPHDGEGCRRRLRQVQWSLLLRLDAHRARRDRALLRHPLGARTVEPARGPVPVVRQKENVGRSRPARHESQCTSNLYSALRVIENAWEHSP